MASVSISRLSIDRDPCGEKFRAFIRFKKLFFFFNFNFLLFGGGGGNGNLIFDEEKFNRL